MIRQVTAPHIVRSSHRQLLDRDLGRCLRAFPGSVEGVVDTRRPGFWPRAWETGVAVAVAHQLGRLPELDGGHRLQAAYGIRSLSTLREALTLLEQAGIQAAPLKGPTLAARLYPDYTWRPTSDVDLLVRSADLDRAVEALERAGGRLEPAYVENRESHLRFNHHLGVSFRGLVVEVHLRASNHFGRPLPSEPLLARSRPRQVLGLNLLQLDPTDELLFLAVHAASHLWLRDILLLDLRLLVEREPIDWERLRAWSAELGLQRVLLTTLDAARQRVGLQLPFPARPWKAWAHDQLRRASGQLGVLIAEDTAGALRNLAAEAIWVDSPAIAARFVTERLSYGASRRLRQRLRASPIAAPTGPSSGPAPR